MQSPEDEQHAPAQVEDEDGHNPEIMIGGEVEDPFPETWPTAVANEVVDEVSE